MNYKLAIENEIKKFGRSTICHSAEGWSSMAYKSLVFPMKYRGHRDHEDTVTKIGAYNQGLYLYIGPAGHDLSKLPDGSYILVNDKKYMIDRAEKVYIKDEVIYIRAAVREYIEIKEDESDE